MKVILSVLCALCLGCLLGPWPAEGGRYPDSCGNNKTHNLVIGQRGPYDRLLYVNHTTRGSQMLRVQSFDSTIPPKGSYPTGRISQVEALDQARDGSGGCAYLVSGGPGYFNVTLHFKSQRGNGINFIVNVWGR